MRRTKEEAACTREAILDAALACFNRQGLSATTLGDIARAAGVTRGAVYWHFEGKQEVLAALRDRVSLPFLDRADTELLHGGPLSPLDRIEHYLRAVFDDLERDAPKRSALRLMHFGVEYVGALETDLKALLGNTRLLARAFEAAYREAEASGKLAPGLSPRLLAMETVIFVSGLVRLWLMDASPGGFRKSAPELIRAHVASKRR